MKRYMERPSTDFLTNLNNASGWGECCIHHYTHIFPDLWQARGEVQNRTGPCGQPSDHLTKRWAFPRRWQIFVAGATRDRQNLHPAEAFRFILRSHYLWSIKGSWSLTIHRGKDSTNGQRGDRRETTAAPGQRPNPEKSPEAKENEAGTPSACSRPRFTRRGRGGGIVHVSFPLLWSTADVRSSFSRLGHLKGGSGRTTGRKRLSSDRIEASRAAP